MIVDDNAYYVLAYAKLKAKDKGTNPTFSDAIRELASSSEYSNNEIQQFVKKQLKIQNNTEDK